MHGFVGAPRVLDLNALPVTNRMMRQVAQSSLNYGWGCGKISVANDAKVNFKETHMAAKKKAAKKKVAKKKAAKKK